MVRRRSLFEELVRLWRELGSELRGAANDARAEWRRGKWEIDNPGQQAVSDAEADAILEWYQSLARPALMLRPDSRITATEAAAQIGGSVWLAEGESWPVDAEGRRLEFVAQLDFRRLPRLAGFSDAGVLRFFVGRDELFGANWDVPEKNGCRILWHPGPISAGRLESPLPLQPDEVSPFQSETSRAEGVALAATETYDLPDADSCHVDARLTELEGRYGASELQDRIFELSLERENGHCVGGYPMFTQPDFRRPGYYDDYDVLLLGLTSDEAIMWGDVGEAMFLMRQADLDRRDFSRVVFYWDCH